MKNENKLLASIRIHAEARKIAKELVNEAAAQANITRMSEEYGLPFELVERQYERRLYHGLLEAAAKKLMEEAPVIQEYIV